ncbi:MAG: DUF4199 domain-containing protein [Duncaniella sp.]|nr:DUF4199 domain-containing protein [Duncaniella sp.]
MVESPYRRGADDGFKFGLYLTTMFFTSIFSEKIALLSLVSLVMIAAVPVIVWQMQRRYCRDCRGAATFPMLWMQGVMIFTCGMAIAGVALAIYMRWINPDFILNQWELMAATGAHSDSRFMQETGRVAQGMIDNGLLPTPMAVVVQLILLAITTGSILSLTMGAILIAMHRRRDRRDIDSIIKNM